MSHAVSAQNFNTDEKQVDWHDETLWMVRDKRDASSRLLPEWEELRELASGIKTNVLSELDRYLLDFERNAQAHGIRVHWARDGAEHNRIVHRIIEQHQARRVVKSKSMLTEECHLNPYLEERGIEIIDTDLGERIVQLSEQTPSHIVMPAIHMKKQEIGENLEILQQECQELRNKLDSIRARVTQLSQEHEEVQRERVRLTRPSFGGGTVSLLTH